MLAQIIDAQAKVLAKHFGRSSEWKQFVMPAHKSLIALLKKPDYLYYLTETAKRNGDKLD